jgi:hypothetical protein
MDLTDRALMVEPLDERVDHVRGEAGTRSSSSTATTNVRTRGRPSARSNESSGSFRAGSASRLAISRSRRSTGTPSPHPQQPRRRCDRVAYGRCTICCSTARRRSKTTTCSYANELGLDLARFDRDRADPDVLARIERDVASGDATGVVRGTPTLFVDGTLYRGGYDPAAFIEALAR